MESTQTAVKVHELRAQRAKAVNEAREIVEKAERDRRALTPEQDARHSHLVAEAHTLAQRISQAERQRALELGNGAGQRGRQGQPLPHEDPANVGTRHSYSLLRAVRALSSKGAIPFDGLEREVSQELQNRSQKTPQGFFMPFRSGRNAPGAYQAEQRALDSTQGAGTIATELDKDWIELLRNSCRVIEAGAREIHDLTGRFAIPRQSGSGTTYWVQESGSPSPSNQVLDQVLFTPHTIGAFTDISRRFFELTNLGDGDAFVKGDLTADIARGIDLAALNGPGGSNQPLGILQNSAITSGRTVSLGANGGAPSWSACVELYTIVSRGNAADLGEFSYIGNADVQGTLATTPKIGSTFPIFLLEDGKVYGKRFLQTQQLPNNLSKGSSGNVLSPMIGGIWNQIVMGFWSEVDILVDPYTGSSSGTVRIVALQDMDIQARHNEAFAVWVDMVSNQTQ